MENECVMHIEDFFEHCCSGVFIDYDGYALPISMQPVADEDEYLFPSDYAEEPKARNALRARYRYVVWFNR